MKNIIFHLVVKFLDLLQKPRFTIKIFRLFNMKQISSVSKCTLFLHSHLYLFTLSGSTRVKAVRKMLVKLTQGLSTGSSCLNEKLRINFKKLTNLKNNFEIPYKWNQRGPL